MTFIFQVKKIHLMKWLSFFECENYWNDAENEEKQFGKFFVKLIKSREICPDFLVRTMRLRWTADGGKSNGEEERTVCQFHYSAWPDHGVPTQVKPLLEMVRLIRDWQASETLPVLVRRYWNHFRVNVWPHCPGVEVMNKFHGILW